MQDITSPLTLGTYGGAPQRNQFLKTFEKVDDEKLYNIIPNRTYGYDGCIRGELLHVLTYGEVRLIAWASKFAGVVLLPRSIVIAMTILFAGEAGVLASVWAIVWGAWLYPRTTPNSSNQR